MANDLPVQSLAVNGGGGNTTVDLNNVGSTVSSLTVTAGNTTRVYGAANPGFTANLNGFVNGEVPAVVSGSGRAPFTRSSRRDRMRVSRTKSPWADPGTRSPLCPLMVKVDSSTRVTVPLPWSSTVG